MKKLSIISGLFFITILWVSIAGCYRDVILPDVTVDPDGPPQAVSFKTDLAPIFNTQCALSGCHVSGAHKPYMTTGDAYLQITNGGYVNNLVPKESILYKKVNGEMKEYMPKATDRQKVYDWIRNGSPNN